MTGSQFTWEYRYPNGVIAVDRLRVPEGRTVELHVTAPAWDVIHSWWIPALGGKIDAIPGRVNQTWFRAERSGVFDGQCAELCGIYHSKMTAAAEVMPASEFDAWLEERRTQQEAAPRRSARRRGRDLARSATGSTARAATGRGSRAQS